MNKEPSLFEEDYPPTGGAGFSNRPMPTADEVMTMLAEGDINWPASIQDTSNFGELPLTVSCELIQHIAASNDGSMRLSREYLKSIIECMI